MKTHGLIRRVRGARAARQVPVSKQADYVAYVRNYGPVLFDIKDDLYVEEMAMFLGSALNRHLIQNYESIKRPRDKCILPAERTQRPDRNGSLLDAYESRWEEGYAALAKFKAHEGHCRVPDSHIEGKFRLGRWVALQRRAKDKMLSRHRRRLNAIGFVWDGHVHAWESGFAALTKFKACEGHCRVPRYHVEGAYKLGQWVSVQRLNRDAISAERRKRLDAIGFVWDWRQHFWEKGFSSLAKFKARKGHCRVPSFHMERKFKLGQWVTTQRRSKDKMPAKRRSQLNKIGFVWRVI